MTRDSCLGTARLASQPAFSDRATAPACPICRQFSTLTVTGYDRHFTGHNPAQSRPAGGCLAGPGRLAARRGRPPTAQLASERTS